jgi:hypothetical protein
MRLLVHASQSVTSHVSVDLSRAYIRVPEKLLDRSQIGTSFQEMSREGVPKGMWMQQLPVREWKPGQDPSYITRSETPPSGVHEQRVERFFHQCRPPITEVFRHGSARRIAERQTADFRTFAEYGHGPAFHVDVTDIETTALAHAKPGAIEQLEHGEVPPRSWPRVRIAGQRRRRPEQCVGVGGARHPGQLLPASWRA